MYNIRPTTKFQKDLKRVKKRGFDIPSQIASSSWTPSGRKIGSILATVLVEASDSTKIGASAAA